MVFYGSEVIGMLAGLLCAFSSVPQAVKIIKQKTAISVSGITFALIFFGESLWLIYGILENLIPLIFWSGTAMILTSIVLYLKFKDWEKERVVS